MVTVVAWARGWTAHVPLMDRAFDLFYSSGVVVAVINMVLCLSLLSIAAVQIAVALGTQVGHGATEARLLTRWLTLAWTPVANIWQTADDASRESPATLSNRSAGFAPAPLERRLLGNRSGPEAAPVAAPWLRPVIPGITLPLGHLWYYLASLALCAVVHELGHAVAAARARIRLRGFGVFLIGVYPGAFVDLPRAQLERAKASAQLRIVCAGVWHNAVTALVAWLLVHSGGLGWVFGRMGWTRVGAGVVVVDVAPTSPLYGRLPLLSTVYKVDDVNLSGNFSNIGGGYVDNISPIARWTAALTDTTSNRDTATAGGFCALVADNVDDGLCCEMSPQFPLGESPDGGIFCFERFQKLPLSPMPPMCFDLRSVLARSGSARCRSDRDCSTGGGGRQTLFGRKGHDAIMRSNSSSSSNQRALCVLPSSPFPESRVMRLYYRPFGNRESKGEMLIYAGSPQTLWLEVQVSSLRPWWKWLPRNLPSQIETLLQYVLSFSLAFCLLNAIPARHLDGDHLLRLLLLIARQRWGGETKQESSGLLLAATAIDDGSDGDSDCAESDDDSCMSALLLSSASPLNGDESDASSSADELAGGSLVAASGDEEGSSSTALPELSGAWHQAYMAATMLTTVLLGWCVIGSVVLLAL
ncbi:hypothetical protein H4R26_001434 [Coemansia thaxteri]|uniref:Endopeptidase S2P n=1 Tax=Coemansia thaxteri TaxID=2663907 RepID=A0A9W8EL59_9FUNG|nr:hypothetical protein H4R26_001434 [Coemansia thaxteri]